MTDFLLMSFAAGVVLAIPFLLVRQRTGSRRGASRVLRHFDPRDAVRCEIEPVALDGRLLPQSDVASRRAP